VPLGVNFNGSNKLEIASLTATDSTDFAMSVWLRTTAGANANALFIVDPSGSANMRAGITGGSPPIFGAQFADASSTSIYNVTSGTTSVNTGGWVNVLCSVDLNHAAGARIGKVYVNDVDVTTSASTPAPPSRPPSTVLSSGAVALIPAISPRYGSPPTNLCLVLVIFRSSQGGSSSRPIIIQSRSAMTGRCRQALRPRFSFPATPAHILSIAVQVELLR
jgi:hypothetical protein